MFVIKGHYYRNGLQDRHGTMLIDVRVGVAYRLADHGAEIGPLEIERWPDALMVFDAGAYDGDYFSPDAGELERAGCKATLRGEAQKDTRL